VCVCARARVLCVDKTAHTQGDVKAQCAQCALCVKQSTYREVAIYTQVLYRRV
jgi:hypothetical protein